MNASVDIFVLGLGTHALPHVGSGKKNEVAVVVLSFIPQTIMPKILQCDLESVKKLVANLEADPSSESTVEIVQVIEVNSISIWLFVILKHAPPPIMPLRT